MTKQKTKIKGVTVKVAPCGFYTVTATAAAVKAWPWDGTSFPCSNLKHRHSFTFESNGDLCDMETRQLDDGCNGEAASALCEDCKALAVEVLGQSKQTKLAEIMQALDIATERLEDDFYDTGSETWSEYGIEYAHARLRFAFVELEKLKGAIK